MPHELEQHGLGVLAQYGVKHWEQYCAPWLISPLYMQGLLSLVRGVELKAHIETQQAAAKNNGPQIGEYLISDKGVAMINIEGTITKYGSSFSGMPYGTVGVRAALNGALRDDKVKSIVLRIDSGGGSSSGVDDLAQHVARANAIKPVFAYIEDIGASAAYYIACQAQRVYANRAAMVGSIGTYAVITDSSEAAKEAGYSIEVIASDGAEFKGLLQPGVEVSDKARDYVRNTVNAVNGHFLSAVQQGRGFDDAQIAAIATGQIWTAQEAKKLKLIDGIESLDAVIEKAVKAKPEAAQRGPIAKQETQIMNEDNAAPVQTAQEKPPALPQRATASLHELKAALPKASAEFYIAQLEKSATVAEAQAAYIAHLETQTAELSAKLAAKPAQVEKLDTKSGGSTSGSASEQWQRELDAELKQANNRDVALRRVEARHPGLRERMLAEVNDPARAAAVKE